MSDGGSCLYLFGFDPSLSLSARAVGALFQKYEQDYYDPGGHLHPSGGIFLATLD